MINDFQRRLVKDLQERWLLDYIEDATDEMLRISIANTIKNMYINRNWRDSLADESRKVHYMSMEFMVGKLTKTNLVNLDLLDEIEESLNELGIDIERIFATEIESKTANGGLGRLAYAILNGLSNKDINASGQTLLYKHGIFQQQIVDGKQVELPDIWRNVEHGYEWYNCLPHKAKICKLFGEVKKYNENGRDIFELVNYTPIQGVPYDVPVVGYHNSRVNSLRLWEAKEVTNKQLKELGLNNFLVSYGNNKDYIECAREITNVLYPDDSNYEGKMLRVKQEYFCTTMALQTIIEEHLDKFGMLSNFAEKNVIHINDTHCSWAVPELMRILIDEHYYSWEDAWKVVTESITYTNHTVLQEALEKWDCNMIRMILPRVYMIIEEINRRQSEDHSKAILKDGLIYTANMLIEAAYSVNGVAAIHSDIIKNETFKEFNEKYPDKFKNVTNGIEGRKWLLCDSIELSNLITEYIGCEWKYDFRKLEKLEKFKYDPYLKEDLRNIKKKYKEELAKYILDTTGIEIDTNAIFMSHTKRLHAYKRQSMVILSVLRLYHELLENPCRDVVPKVFIFSAKSAPGYYFAKNVIKVINEVANMINNDHRINGKLKVVFLENYNVGVAEKIIKGTDVSIQVPTAGQEASGTGNMKYMMLGALTHATLDGANVEIHDLVKTDMYLFGLRLKDVEKLNSEGYSAWDTYNNNFAVKQVFDDLINGFIPNIYHEGRAIYQEILSNDVYYVTKDMISYLESLKDIDRDWRNPDKWYGWVINNIAMSGFFDINRSIENYCDRVWKINYHQCEI